MSSIVIKDAVHGMIALTELEKRIIDSEEFQRLRNIKHLGLTYLVYPSAMHTRFEHSIGTMHISSSIAESLSLSKEDKEKIRLYALLHDIGHGPFSHTSERALMEIDINADHEALGERVILNSKIKDIINERWNVEEIINLKNEAIGQVVHGAVGADRIDYLKRDSRATGVAYGIIDDDRLISQMFFDGEILGVEMSGLEAAEYLLIARFMMFNTVYLHHTVRIASLMLRLAIKHAVERGEDWKKIMAMEDAQLVDFLLHFSKETKYWIERLRKRRLLKRLAELKSISSETMEKLNEIGVYIDPPYSFIKNEVFYIKDGSTHLPCYEASSLIKHLRCAEEERQRYLVVGDWEKKPLVEKVLKS